MLNPLPFTPFSDFEPDELRRSYDPNDIQGASYRILSEVEQGRGFQEALDQLGQRCNDPENFVAELILNLINQIRFFLSAQIVRKTSDLNDNTMNVGGELSRAFPEIDFSPEEIASVFPFIRDRLKMNINSYRVCSYRFPF